MQLQRHIKRSLHTSFGYRWSDLKGDLTGGLVAGALAIPASLSFGELSGLGPVAGLYGALALGVFGALVGNTRGIISGPNAPVAIIMALVVSKYSNSIAEVLAAAILAGVIQIVFGLLRFGRYIAYVPASLLTGFFTGVGILLVTTQAAPAMGAANGSGSAAQAMIALPATIQNANLHAVAITAICLAAVILWRGPLQRIAPSQLILLIAGTLAGIFWLTEAPAVGPINVGISTLQWPQLSVGFLLRAVQPAFIIAMICSMTILTTSMMVESITGQQQQTDRLLVGHGIGNIAAGFVGGLPGSAAPATLVNAYSGGRTVVSNLTVTAMVLLTLVTGLSALIELLPKAVMASILIVVGVSVIDWRLIRRLHQTTVGFALVTALTAFLVVFVDVITALIVGFIVGMFVNSRNLEAFEVPRLVSVPLLDSEVLGPDAEVDDPFGANTGLVRFPDRVSVASAREIGRIVSRDVGAHQTVIFDLSLTEYIDDTAAMMLGTLINTMASRGRRDFVITGMRDQVAQKLKAFGFLDRVPPEHLVPDMTTAKRTVKPMLEADLANNRAA